MPNNTSLLRNSLRVIAPMMLTTALLGTGCAGEEEVGDEGEFFERGAQCDDDEPFWEQGASLAVNQDIEVYAGATAAMPPCLITGFVGPGVSSRSVEGFPNNPLTLAPVAILDKNMIRSTLGIVQCTVFESDKQDGLYRLETAGGNVTLSMFGSLVFEGDIKKVFKWGTGAWKKQVKDHLLYQFHGDQVFDGLWWDSEPIVTVDAEIEDANPMRRMSVAAFVDGQCGTPSAMSYPVPD